MRPLGGAIGYPRVGKRLARDPQAPSPFHRIFLVKQLKKSGDPTQPMP